MFRLRDRWDTTARCVAKTQVTDSVSVLPTDTPPRPLPPTARNHVWAYDFVFDTCANRQTLKCLTIVDEWTRECLAIDVAGGIRSGA